MKSHELDALTTCLSDPGRLSMKLPDRESHARDESFYTQHLPDLVIWPETTDEVSKILKWANEHYMPVTAWGGGSSVEGNPIPVQGGIVLDMTRMSTILQVLPEDMQVRVQPGITGDELNRHLGRHGLFFPVIPSSSNVATIGGMIANNAGGIYTVKYGSIREYTLALEIVLAGGEVLRTGSRSFKTSAGYDLTSLFVGSEGTLGVVTEASLRVRGLPQSRLALVIAFENIQQAIDASLDILACGLEPAALEFMDTDYVCFANQVKQIGWPEQPILIVEFHGLLHAPTAELAEVEILCQDKQGIIIGTASNTQEVGRIWEARGGVRPAIRSIFPGTGVIAGDVGVPISQIPLFVQKAGEIGREQEVRIVTFGHVGEGNLHMWVMYMLEDVNSWQNALDAEKRLVQYALDIGGTVTAEHGLGSGYKRDFLPLEHPSAVGTMEALKRTLDPHGILNPGKMFPERSE